MRDSLVHSADVRLSHFNIILNAHKSDSFPSKALEATACGLPVGRCITALLVFSCIHQADTVPALLSTQRRIYACACVFNFSPVHFKQYCSNT